MSITTRGRIAVVFGSRIFENGTICSEFQYKIMVASRLLREGKVDWVVVTGRGIYPKHFLSEAAAGKKYFPVEQQPFVLVEEDSEDTIENLIFTRRLLEKKGIEVTQVVLISSFLHLLRIKHRLISRFWPEVKEMATYMPVRHEGWRSRLDYSIGYLASLIDPSDRWFLDCFRWARKNVNYKL